MFLRESLKSFGDSLMLNAVNAPVDTYTHIQCIAHGYGG